MTIGPIRTRPYSPARAFAASFAYFVAGVAVAGLVLGGVLTVVFDQAVGLIVSGIAIFASGWTMRGVAGPPIASDREERHGRDPWT